VRKIIDSSPAHKWPVGNAAADIFGVSSQYLKGKCFVFSLEIEKELFEGLLHNCIIRIASLLKRCMSQRKRSNTRWRERERKTDKTD
jgi:hypothetical protein